MRISKGIKNMKKKKEGKLLYQLQEEWNGNVKPLSTISSLTHEELERIYHNKVISFSSSRIDCHRMRRRTFFMTLITSISLVALAVVALVLVLPSPDGYVMNLTADHAAVSAVIIQILYVL